MPSRVAGGVDATVQRTLAEVLRFDAARKAAGAGAAARTRNRAVKVASADPIVRQAAPAGAGAVHCASVDGATAVAVTAVVPAAAPHVTVTTSPEIGASGSVTETTPSKKGHAATMTPGGAPRATPCGAPTATPLSVTGQSAAMSGAVQPDGEETHENGGGVFVGVGVRVAVCDGVGDEDRVSVDDMVGVCVCDGVTDEVADGVMDGVRVGLVVGVGVADADAEPVAERGALRDARLEPETACVGIVVTVVDSVLVMSAVGVRGAVCVVVPRTLADRLGERDADGEALGDVDSDAVSSCPVSLAAAVALGEPLVVAVREGLLVTDGERVARVVTVRVAPLLRDVVGDDERVRVFVTVCDSRGVDDGGGVAVVQRVPRAETVDAAEPESVRREDGVAVGEEQAVAEKVATDGEDVTEAVTESVAMDGEGEGDAVVVNVARDAVGDPDALGEEDARDDDVGDAVPLAELVGCDAVGVHEATAEFDSRDAVADSDTSAVLDSRDAVADPEMSAVFDPRDADAVPDTSTVFDIVALAVCDTERNAESDGKEAEEVGVL